MYKYSKEPIIDIMEPIMDIEHHQWRKRLLVSHRIRKLLIPGYLVVSEASTPHYFHTGLQRSKEKHSAVFQYTLSGSGIFQIGKEKHILNEGMCFCTYVADKNIKYYYPENAKESWRFLYLTYYDKLGVTKALNEQLGYVYKIPRSEGMIQQLLAYGKIEDRTVEMNAGTAHLLINSIVAVLANQIKPVENKSPQKNLILKSLSYIEDKIEQPYNASLLADDLQVSQEHLNRIFQEELGKGPYKCICESKLQRACELLKNTSQSISQIAIHVGYDPGSHFARLFKRIIGVTPSQFRKSSSISLNPFINERF